MDSPSLNPQIVECRKYLRSGDTLHVHSIDRLCRNLTDLQRVVSELNEKGIIIKFHKEGLTFTGRKDPMNNLMMQLLGAVSEFERALIKERQREGIEAAKAKGKHLGRRSSLTADQIEEIKTRAANGESKAILADEYGVSRQTIYTVLKPAVMLS
ncbi:MAG TPA: transposase [Desulfobulbaceae bacterium]|nr:transposase [Desulfobulbaceae bacterium]